jgi:hypothetical protein
MISRNVFMAAALVAGLNCIPIAHGADDAALGKDLKVTIALQGQPCDQVVDVKRNGDSDYLATCKDGNRYRVFVDAQGQVVVKKQ